MARAAIGAAEARKGETPLCPNVRKEGKEEIGYFSGTYSWEIVNRLEGVRERELVLSR